MLSILNFGKLLHDVTTSLLSNDDEEEIVLKNFDLSRDTPVNSYPPQHWSWTLTCSICLDFYNDPVIMQCGHTFCRGCIDKVASFNRTRFPRLQSYLSKVRCPKCRSTGEEQSNKLKYVTNLAVAAVLENWFKDGANVCKNDLGVQTDRNMATKNTQTEAKGKVKIRAIRLSSGKIMYVRNVGRIHSTTKFRKCRTLNNDDKTSHKSKDKFNDKSCDKYSARKSVSFQNTGYANSVEELKPILAGSMIDTTTNINTGSSDFTGCHASIQTGDSIDFNRDLSFAELSGYGLKRPSSILEPSNPFGKDIILEPYWTESKSAFCNDCWCASYTLFLLLTLWATFQHLRNV